MQSVLSNQEIVIIYHNSNAVWFCIIFILSCSHVLARCFRHLIIFYPLSRLALFLLVRFPMAYLLAPLISDSSVSVSSRLVEATFRHACSLRSRTLFATDKGISRAVCSLRVESLSSSSGHIFGTIGLSPLVFRLDIFWQRLVDFKNLCLS